MSKASDLLWDYQAAEKAIEAAEQAILEAKAKKLSIFGEVIKIKSLVEALESTGVVSNNSILTIESVNSAVIEVRPMAVYAYDMADEDDE